MFPIQIIQTFNEGRKLYRERKWEEAIRAFKESSRLHFEAFKKPDETSIMYTERCEYFAKTPPEDNWDGTWIMKTK